MNLIYQTIDENEEILYDFFEENRKQLELYKSLFDKNDNNKILKIIRKDIESNYIPSMKTWFLYKVIQKNLYCKKIYSNLCFLYEVNSKEFLYYLLLLLDEITKLNILK
jgi:hypothetical protein